MLAAKQRLERPTFEQNQREWNHKQLPLPGGEADFRDRGGGAGGRSRSAKREAFYARLAGYSNHFSALLRREWEAEKAALRDEICGRSVAELRAAGLLLDRLCVRHVDELYGSPVLRLSLRPPSRGRRSEGGGAAPAAPPLPYHTFAVGDAVTLCLGEAPVLPADGAETEESVPGVLLQRTDANVLVVVPRLSSARLDELRESYRLCLYRGASAVPFERSQSAIDALCDPSLPADAMAHDLRDVIACLTPIVDLTPLAMPARAGRGAEGPTPAIVDALVEALARGRPAYLGAASAKAAKAALAAVVAAASAPPLNPSQAAAVTAALQRRLTLIQGPPGTGKTRTACHLLAACARLRREGAAGGGPGSGGGSGGGSDGGSGGGSGSGVLAVASSNVAADELLRGLSALGVRALRLGQPAVVSVDLRGATLAAMLARDEGVLAARGRLATAQGGRGGAAVAGAFADVLRVEALASRRLLTQAPVVVATAIGAGRLAELLAPLPSARAGSAAAAPPSGVASHFRSVLVDEASQVIEPASLVPLLLGCEQLILVGDPRQLPPTVVDRDAAAGGLFLTLFDRLSVCGVATLLLDTQYRMHPAIADFPNQAFYSGRLRDAPSLSDRPPPAGFDWPDRGRPVAFLCVAGVEQREESAQGSSVSNLAEARRVALAVRGLLEAGEPAEALGVISPYAAQVRAIDRELARLPPRLRPQAVQVSSVDGFQGCERDVIVFSAVRSNPQRQVGFLADARRLNVALTRARRGLLVVGDPDTLASDPTWLKYLRWLQGHGLLIQPEAAAAAAAAADGSEAE